MRIRIRRLAALGASAAALAVTLAAAAPAMADPSTDPSSSNEPTGQRAEKLCARLPQLEARANKVLARLQGDADTPGSVAFAKKRADRARANGNTDLATALDSRAKARQDLIPVLQKKKDGLPKAHEWCQAHGFAVGK